MRPAAIGYFNINVNKLWGARPLAMGVLFSGGMAILLRVFDAPPWSIFLFTAPSLLLLPGLSFLAVFNKELLERPSQAFPFGSAISIAITPLWCYVGTRYLGAELTETTTALIIVACVAMTFRFSILSEVRWGDIGVWSVLRTFIWFAIILLPLAALLDLDRPLMGHGLRHGAIIAEILSGHIPPDNINLAGTALHYYWGAHLLIAAVSGYTGVSLVQSVSVLLAFSLLVFAGLAYHLATRLVSSRLAIFAGYFIGFGLNLAGPLIFAIRLLTGYADQDHFFQFNWISVVVTMGLHDFMPLTAQYQKFLSFSGMPFAVPLWLLAFIVASPWYRSSLMSRALILGACLASATFMHPPTGLVILISVPPAILVSGMMTARRKGDGWLPGFFSPLVVTSAIGMLVGLFVVFPYTGELSSDSNGIGLEIGLFWVNFAWLLGGLMLHLPLVAVAVLKLPIDVKSGYLMTVLGMLILASQPVMIGEATYKLIWFAAIPAGMLGVKAIMYLRRRHPRWVARKAIFALAMLAFVNNALTGTGFAFGTPTVDLDYEPDGPAVVFKNYPVKSRVLRWIRMYTPSDSIVLDKTEHCGSSLTSIVSMRRAFLKSPCYYLLDDYAQEVSIRKALVKQIFSPGSDKESAARGVAERMSWPVYVVLAKGDAPDDYSVLKEEYALAPSLYPVMFDSDATVYRILRKGRPKGVEKIKRLLPDRKP